MSVFTIKQIRRPLGVIKACWVLWLLLTESPRVWERPKGRNPHQTVPQLATTHHNVLQRGFEYSHPGGPSGPIKNVQMRLNTWKHVDNTCIVQIHHKHPPGAENDHPKLPRRFRSSPGTSNTCKYESIRVNARKYVQIRAHTHKCGQIHPKGSADGAQLRRCISAITCLFAFVLYTCCTVIILTLLILLICTCFFMFPTLIFLCAHPRRDAPARPQAALAVIARSGVQRQVRIQLDLSQRK